MAPQMRVAVARFAVHFTRNAGHAWLIVQNLLHELLLWHFLERRVPLPKHAKRHKNATRLCCSGIKGLATALAAILTLTRVLFLTDLTILISSTSPLQHSELPTARSFDFHWRLSVFCVGPSGGVTTSFPAVLGLPFPKILHSGPQGDPFIKAIVKWLLLPWWMGLLEAASLHFLVWQQ